MGHAAGEASRWPRASATAVAAASLGGARSAFARVHGPARGGSALAAITPWFCARADGARTASESIKRLNELVERPELLADA